MDNIKVGIIGCGQIAKTRHVKELAANPQATLAAFCDIIAERAEEMQKQHGGKVYTDYRDLLADKDIDAVFVLCCNNVHAQITVDALNAGKHVLCEKPMGVTLTQCEAMIGAAEKNSRILMLGHNQRMLPAHRKVRELIRSGVYGNIITFRTTFGHKGCEHFSHGGLSTWLFKKEESGFGASADLGVHKADLLRFLLGEEITEVSAFAGTLAKTNEHGLPIEVEDNIVCLLRTESGKIGTLTASWTYTDEDNSTIIYLEKANIHIFDTPGYDIRIVEQDGGVKTYQLGGIQTNEHQTASGIPDEFIASILEQRAPAITGEDGMRAVAIILACLQSSGTGKVVALQ